MSEYFHKIGRSIGTGVTAVGNRSGGRSWITQYKSLCDFFWVEGKLSATELLDQSGNNNHVTITGKDFVTDYIPATSAAKFDCPNNATFIANDTDNLWINKNEQSRGVEVSELIGYDFARTVVWYDNDAPHHIRAIMILKSTVTLTAAQINKMHTDFQLSMFWSGVLNVNGFTKANRGLAQNVWTAVSADALDYSDTYQTAVLADGGEIISRKVLESEYQRLIDTGDIATCWYSYHYQCGIKRVNRTYSEVQYSCVTKWYNLSPVAGRFAESVIAYAQTAEPEYTANGIRMRPVNLDGGVRCGLNSPNTTVLTNINNTIKLRGIVSPASYVVSSIQRKGIASDDGHFSINDASGRKLGFETRVPPTSISRLTTDAVFENGVFLEYKAILAFDPVGGNGTITATVNGVNKDMAAQIAGSVYPAQNAVDLIGSANTLGRSAWDGLIKQVEMFYV